jgi:Tfp pilus assembly protein PilO
MAEGATGDWTAGMVAIAAAVLIGAGLTIGAYFGASVPMKEQRQTADRKLSELMVDQAMVEMELERVRGMEADAKRMEERVAALEENFAVGKPADLDVPKVRDEIEDLCQAHNLDFLDVVRQQRDAQMVYKGEKRIEFQHGLAATLLMVDVKGTFHDFGRFLRDLEMLDTRKEGGPVVIAESLSLIGDNNGKREHTFRLQAYVVEKRDLTTVGR